MKKILTFLLSIFIILFLGVCEIANAESFVQVYATENYVTGTWQNGYTYKSVNGSADNLLVPSLDSWSVNNLDLTNVDADLIQFNFIAGYYQQQNFTSVTNWENITIHASFNSRTVVPCTVSGTGQFLVKCPIPKNDRILTRISFSLMGAFPWRIGIHQYINAMKSDTKEIIESQNSGNDETNNKIDDLNNNLTSSDVSNNNTNSTINNINNMMPTNETISSVVSMPLVLLDSLNTSFSGTCTKLTLIDLNLRGKSWKFELPCINMSEIMGSSWAIIDTLMSGVLIFAMGKSMLRTFVKFTSLDSNLVEEAYQ